MALASLPQDQHALAFQALQTRWRYTTHPGKTCYKPNEHTKPRDHVNLDLKALSDWTAAIINKVPGIDIESPPSGKEWEWILKPKVNRDVSISETPRRQQFSQAPIHNHIYMPHHSRRGYSPHISELPYNYRQSYNPFSSPSVHTPTSAHRRMEVQSSPIVLKHES